MPLKPDPTFYPSPRARSRAARGAGLRRHAQHAGNGGEAKPDALTVVDVKDGSSTRGRSSAGSTCPTSATSCTTSAGTRARGALPLGAAPARRAPLLARPGPALARIHVVDVKDDPRQPEARQGRRGRRAREATGYSRPHTVHCGPDGLYMSALGNPAGDGPGGVLLLDHDDFSPLGPVGDRPRPPEPRLRRLVEHRLRHAPHERVGHAEHGRERR